MAGSLQTAVSGMIAHQRKLDVVANNLANMNTTAFKSQSISFADQLYNVIKPATGGTETFGGVNSNQLGSGVRIGQISRRLGQGVMEATGQVFDFAIQGEGFFVVNDGLQNLFTRAGSFSLDSLGRLVDGSTGFLVQRTGTVGEGGDSAPKFQTPGDFGIKVPIGATIPGQDTNLAAFDGNLDASATKPLVEVVISNAPFLVGGIPADGSTLLNDLDTNGTDYVTGDSLDIAGVRVDGSTYSTTLAVDGTTTIDDVIAAVNAELNDATASIDLDGNFVIQANSAGEADLALSIEDDITNTGSTDFYEHRFIIETDGKEGDIFETTIEVFDPRGGAHAINLQFQKVDDNIWDMTATALGKGDVVIDGFVEGIQFNEDGTLDSVNGQGLGDLNIEFQFNGFTQVQTIDLDVDQLSHLNASSSISVEQNGFPTGSLATVQINGDGTIEGVATSGRRVDIAQIALATFQNTGALEAAGENFFRDSANSGAPQVGIPTTSGRGSVKSGQLEQSNVDVAQEFTQLIVAQRGFSANARTVTVSDEVLEELTNIIR